MTNFIKVVTLIIVVLNGGFVLGNIETDKALSDSNPIFGGIEEAFSKTIVEEDKEWFGHRALPLSMDYELLLIPEVVPIPQPVAVYGKGKGKSKYGYAYGGYGKGKGKSKYGYAYGGYAYGKGKGKSLKNGFVPPLPVAETQVYQVTEVQYIHKGDGSPKHTEDGNMYSGH
jgi:hypothetical protein